MDSNSRLHTKGTMLWSYWLTIHKLIQFSDSFCILPHKVTFPIHHQAPYCPISNEMNLFPQTSFHRKTILFHLKILLLARLQCLLFTCNSHNGANEFLYSKKEHTVVCILVWTASFPRFWRKHSWCTKKMIPHMNELLSFIRWSKK